MLICKDCRCYHPVSVSDRYCGYCCIGDSKNPIAINADITGCCLFEPKQPKKPKKLTNGDRIRQMTDEELALILVIDGCSMCEDYDICKEGAGCCNGVLKWLKQEAKEGASDD